MSASRITRGFGLLCVLALLAQAIVWIADARAPVIAFVLPPADVSSSQPGLYMAPIRLPKRFWFVAGGDLPATPRGSTLKLFESDRPLGPPHAQHAEIPKGGGRYSHWDDWLYFSTPDDSDPRTNGRSYRVEIRTRLLPALRHAANGLVALCVLVALPWALVRGVKALRARRAAREPVPVGVRRRRTRRHLRIACLAALAVQVAALVADARAPVLELTLQASDIVTPQPGLYAVAVPSGKTDWYIAPGDGPETPTASTLALFEGREALGPAHAQHAEIPSGRGRYSHWGHWLYFGASDDSDPRTNGRRYRVEIGTRLLPQVRYAASGLLAATVLLLFLQAMFDAVTALRARTTERGAGAVLRAGFDLAARAEAGSVWRRRVCAVLALICGSLVALEPALPRVDIPIRAPAMQSAAGQMRIAEVPIATSFPFTVKSDLPHTPRASSLQLLEDGRPIGIPHSEHSLIETKGGGQYSYWDGYLYFSSSDGSDPASGAHRYAVRVTRVVEPMVSGAAFLLLAFTAALAYPLRAHAVLGALAEPFACRHGRGAIAGAFGLAALLACARVFYVWFYLDGQVPAPSLAGWLPLSDALGYNTCATQAALLGRFFEHFEFCSRRALYPSFLAGMHLLTGSRTALILGVQASLAGISIAVLSLCAARVMGRLAAVLVALLLAMYASEYVIGLFMTEFIGFVCGLLGLSLLLGVAPTSGRRLFVAFAMLSIALVARNGAMFVLPALLVWMLIENRRCDLPRIVTLGATAVAGLALGFVLQHGVLVVSGINPADSFGNFATVLYRLSVGAKDWTQATVDHPELAALQEVERFHRVYEFALANIRARPTVLLQSLNHAMQTYLSTVYDFSGAQRHADALCALTVLGLLACVRTRRRPSSRLLLWLAAAELAAAPLIVEDGGMRVFAASIPIRVLLCAAGLHAILSASRGALTRIAAIADPRAPADLPDVSPWPVAVLGCSIVCVMALPYLPPLAAALRPAPVPVTAEPCPAGTRPFVIDLDHESFAVGASERPADGLGNPLRITKDRMLEGVRATWYEDQVAGLDKRQIVIQGIDRSPARFGRAELLTLAQGTGMLATKGLQAVCFAPGQGPKIANFVYQEIVRHAPVQRPRR